MRVAINASPLLFLARLGVLNILNMYEEVYCTSEVLSEILRGIELGYGDAILVKKIVDEGRIKEMKTKEQLERYEELLGLHRGEISTLLAARELKLDQVIVDDRRAIKVAKYFGLKPLSTPFVLLEALKRGNIGCSTFERYMGKLIDFGYRISPKLYMEILKRARELG